MLSRFRSFLLAAEPDLADAGEALRLLYAASFLVQVGLASVVGIALGLVGSDAPSGAGLGPALFWFSLSMPLLGLVLSLGVARVGGRPAALTATILAAVLFSAPAWFLAFALATRHGGWPVLAMVGAVALGYALGLFVTGRFAEAAVRPAPESEGRE